MEFNDLNLRRKYFLVSLHCQSAESFGLKKVGDNCYIDNTTKEKYYYKKSSYDFGWGEESCWILERDYSFNDLIKLSLFNIREFPYDRNNVGAIDFIMCGSPRQNNMVQEFLSFLKNNVILNCTLSMTNFDNLRLFFFTADGEYLQEKYVNIFNQYTVWKEIKNDILKLIKEKVSENIKINAKF